MDKFNKIYEDMIAGQSNEYKNGDVIVESDSKRKIIFKTNNYSFNDARKFLQAEFLIENPTDEEIETEIKNHYKVEDAVLETTMERLNKNLKNTIVVLDDTTHWNTVSYGLLEIGDFIDLMHFLKRYWSFELFIENNELKAECYGPNKFEYFVFREIKQPFGFADVKDYFNDNRGDNENRMYKFYTTSLAKYFKDVKPLQNDRLK
jgi:hypothetical protein